MKNIKKIKPQPSRDKKHEQGYYYNEDGSNLDLREFFEDDFNTTIFDLKGISLLFYFPLGTILFKKEEEPLKVYEFEAHEAQKVDHIAWKIFRTLSDLRIEVKKAKDQTAAKEKYFEFAKKWQNEILIEINKKVEAA
jgi:hypothetical protein